MDRVLNPKDEKKTMYEIYRACRLCGGGAGYKMPIIQSVVDLETHGLEMRQKIKECVQIEVNHTDRMPPLICELCVDKVNDFYDFLTLCQQTNRKTRQRLGLPLQTKSKGSTDGEKCILGVTEPINTESDVECVSAQRGKKSRVKKESIENVKIKIETKKEVSKFVASKKKDTMLQDMAERAKQEVSMLRNEGGLLKKEGSTLTEKAKRGSKRALEDIELATQRDKKNKVMKSKYKKIQKEKENGRSALSSRSSTPDGQWERRRTSPANKRTTRQNTEPLSDVLLFDDTPLPDSRCKLKRPREKEVKVETPPPAKKVKLPEPKPKETPKPGPKSKKLTKEPEPPKPAVKDPEPPKPMSKPKPASKKDIKPSQPTSKPSKTKSKPEPVKTRPEPVKTKPEPVKPKPEEPVKPKPAPKPVETKYTCGICDHQVKTHQGLIMHNNVKHTPTFTAPKFACNACELWFPTVEECAAHHRTHRDGLPYKCHRCYGYFKLQQEYESHFSENLCLSVYEVPDVQCWRCLHRFATGALLSAHRCPGEDGRPGGKCSKCNRSYALLKNQLKHEETCTYKKKGEVTIDPDVQSRLLAMQVKVARCDALLSGPRVEVANISHNYGLDSKAHYPYLPATINKKTPTKAMLKANHMVTIDDAVKAEYWGSDSNDSQTVDSLRSMTLKTINKVDKGDDNDDLTKKIFNIIDNLSIDDGPASCDSENLLEKFCDTKEIDGESKGGEKDNVSNDNDDSQSQSDSILDKDDGKSDDTVSRVNDESDKMEVGKDVPEGDSVVPDDVRVNSTAADVNSAETKDESDSIDINADADKVSDSPKKSDTISVRIEDGEQMEVDCEKSYPSTQNVGVSSAQSEGKLTTELDKRLSGSEDNTADDNDQKNKETDDAKSSIDDNDIAMHEANKTFHDDIKTSEDIDMTSKSDSIKEQISIETSESTEEKASDIEKSNETQHFSSGNDSCLKNDNIDSSNQATQDCSLNLNKDKLESDNKEPDNIDAIVNKPHKIDVNQEESYPPIINNEVFSKIDAITNKILKETETSHDNSADEHSASTKTQRSDNHSDSLSLNSLRSVNDIELQDKFNVDDLSDDDKKLMAELDAQIGEINEKHQENDDVTSNDQNKENDQKASENYSSENNCNDIGGANDNSGVNDTASINDNHSNQTFSDKNINPAVNLNNQNGPSNNEINGNRSNDQRRESEQKSTDYLIDNLLRKQDDLKSLELDCISDEEFNFQA